MLWATVVEKVDGTQMRLKHHCLLRGHETRSVEKVDGTQMRLKPYFRLGESSGSTVEKVDGTQMRLKLALKWILVKSKRAVEKVDGTQMRVGTNLGVEFQVFVEERVKPLMQVNLV